MKERSIMGKQSIDINCDLGEGFGAYSIGQDAALMPLITSANIACGFHAGDPATMEAAVRLAKRHGVAVGAHPGYPDLQGFGRRNMDLALDEVRSMLLYQLGALAGIAHANGMELVHAKPHGALYNQAARNKTLAEVVARSVKEFNPGLILVGLAGSLLIAAGKEAGLQVASEGFPERAYEPDGSLRSRGLPGAMIEDPETAAEQGLALARGKMEIERDGKRSRLAVDTLCIHGDSRQAVPITKALRDRLQENGIEVKALVRPGYLKIIKR
jgi:UPF0271 protein